MNMALRVSPADAQNQSPYSGFAHGQCNSLKMFQPPNMAAAQNLRRRNPHAQINCVCLTYGHRNLLNQNNYSATRESANWMILLNSVESPESDKLLISSKSSNGGSRDEHMDCLGSAFIRIGCIQQNHNYADLHSWENQHSSELNIKRKPNLVYEKNQQVNQPSLRGSVQRLHGSLRPAQNLYTEIIGAQNLQVTKSHSQNKTEVIGSVHSMGGDETFVGVAPTYTKSAGQPFG